MMRSVRPPLVTLTVLLALAAAGCGEGGGGGGPLSKQEFVEQADAVCEKYAERISAIPVARSAGELPLYVGRVLPLLREQLVELQALRPPTKDRRTVSRMLGEFTTGMKAATRFRKLATSKRGQAELRKGLEASKRSRKIARTYGLEVCASTL